MQLHSKIIRSILFYERKMIRPFSFFWYVLRKIIMELFYNCEINPNSFVDLDAIKTFDIPHPYGIIIHPSVTINKNVKIYQFVTIGAKDNISYTGAILEKDIIVGAKATILGAHSLVLRSCNKNDKVIGVFK